MTALLLLLLACTPGKTDGDASGNDASAIDDTGDSTTDSGTPGDGGADTGDTGEPPPPPDPTLALAVDGGVLVVGDPEDPLDDLILVDPLRQEGLEIDPRVEHSDTGTVTLLLLGTDGTTAAVLAEELAPGTPFSWDLRDSGGVPVDAGDWILKGVLLEAGAVVASQELGLYSVRSALTRGTFGGPDVDDDGRIPLLWHEAPGASVYWNDGGSDPSFVVDGFSTGGGAEILASQVPALWEDLATPPESTTHATLPAAYPYDARPLLTVQLSHELGGAAEGVAWSADIEGWTLVEGDVATGTLTFQRDEALADGPGVVEETLTFALLAEDSVFSTQEIPARFYATMGAPTFRSTASPHMLWVQAADDALRAIDGVEADDAAVRDALVEWVFREAELRYDTDRGASFYMGYGRSWDDGTFAFRSFLNRTNGEIVNCSDCSGIMGVFANMLGVELDYAIILSNFSLNEIKAIGVEDYTSCPFGPYSCGFSYHAVTTHDDGDHIWDATLALDGDDDPGSEPYTELLVQEVPGDEYLERLVRAGSADYYYADSRVRISP